jgi:lambda family phage tail tape measure protein
MSDIRYTVDVDVNGGISNLKSLQTQVNSLSGNFVNLKTAIGAAAGAFAGIAVGQFVSGVVDATTTFERYQTVLTTFLGSQNAANRELTRLQEIANRLPQDLQDVADAFIIFQRYGLDATNQGLTEFSNIATASGKSLSQLAEALGDALTGEYERLKEFGIKVSNENGVLQARIGDDIVATASTAKGLVDQLQELGNTRFAGAAEANANTLSQAMSNLRGAVFEAQVAFGEGLKPALIEINNEFAAFLRANEQVAEELGAGLGEALRVLADLSLFVAENIDTLKNIIVALTTIKLVTFLANAAGEFSKLANGARNASEGLTGLKVIFGSLASGKGIFGSLGIAIRALIGPIGLAVGAAMLLNKIINDVFDVDIIGEFAGALVTVAKGALNEVYEVFSNIEAIYDRLVGNENIRNLSFEELKNSGLDTITVIEEMERRLGELVGPEWFQDFTMFESAERIRDEMKAYVQAARDKMAADEMMRLAEESANEAAVVRAQIFAEQLAPFQDYINKATEYSKIDYSTPLEAANERFQTAQETIEGLNAALEASSSAALPNFNDLMAAATDELEAARIELEKLEKAGTFRGFFDNLIDESNKAVEETKFLEWALEDLNLALENGAISPEVYAEALERVNSALGNTGEEARKAQQALEGAIDSATNYMDSLNESTADAQFELESLNMSPLEKQIADVSRSLDRDLQRQVRELNAALEEGADPTAIQNEINRITSATQQALQTQTDLVTQSYEQQRSWSYGWQQAFQEYQDNATNSAERAGEVFGKVTKGMEDSIVGFAKTGKFEFKDLVADILETILRSNIQKLIAQVFGGFGGGGGTGGLNPFAGFFANGGTIPAGQFGVVGERGPEFVSGPATVTPMGGSQMVNYYINAVDAPSFRQMIARDPGFIHAVAQQGSRATPGRRR